jgi:hypothetical protein
VTDHDTPLRTTSAPDLVGQGLADTLLADIAIRVQLSPTLHRLATDRYQTLDHWIQREGSPLYGLVETTYAQGSMRIGATINSRVTNDEFDIDAVTQLRLAIATPPSHVLDILFDAVRGEPGSRYFGCTRRRSRCVTISYKGGMHVDLTPAILQIGTPPRQSWIFEHESHGPFDAGRSLIANPYGFGEWFKQRMPDDNDFSRWFLGRTQTYEERILAAEPVPPPVPVGQKSRVIVALQLFKRWRNVQYDTRTGRRPPSVVLSKLVADAATDAAMSGPGLLHVLLQLAQSLLDEFQRCESNSLLIRVANPVCPDDVLTDRWPGNLGAQATFIADLRNLIADLLKLQRTSNIDDIRRILVSLFGEAPALKAIEPHLKTLPRGPMSVTSTGGVIAGTAVAGSSVARTVPRHTFHGDGEDGL